VRIGVEKGTTGDLFVQARFRQPRRVTFSSVDRAVRALRDGRIDLLIHDGPTIWWLATRHEADGLVGVFRPLTEESLAWAVRRGDTALRSEASAALEAWKADGTLKELFAPWAP
jgi:ABC-type amino acid transport substrate-binding protein